MLTAINSAGPTIDFSGDSFMLFSKGKQRAEIEGRFPTLPVYGKELLLLNCACPDLRCSELFKLMTSKADRKKLPLEKPNFRLW